MRKASKIIRKMTTPFIIFLIVPILCQSPYSLSEETPNEVATLYYQNNMSAEIQKWRPDGAYVMLGSKILEVGSKEQYFDLSYYDFYIEDASWSFDGSMIIFGNRYGDIWDQGNLLINFDDWNNTVHPMDKNPEFSMCTAVEWHPKMNVIASQFGKYAQLINYGSWSLATEFETLNNIPGSMDWDPEGNYLATAGLNNEISIWDFNSWSLSRKLSASDVNVDRVFWSPDGSYIAGVDNRNSNLIVWNTDDWTIEHQRGGVSGSHIMRRSFGWLHDGKYCILGIDHMEFAIMEAGTWNIVTSVEIDDVYTDWISCSPTEDLVAINGDIWEIDREVLDELAKNPEETGYDDTTSDPFEDERAILEGNDDDDMSEGHTESNIRFLDENSIIYLVILAFLLIVIVSFIYFNRRNTINSNQFQSRQQIVAQSHFNQPHYPGPPGSVNQLPPAQGSFTPPQQNLTHGTNHRSEQSYQEQKENIVNWD